MPRNWRFHAAAALPVAVCLLLAGCAGALPPAQGFQPWPPPAADAAKASVQREDMATALYELAFSQRQQALFVASAGGLTAEAKDSPPSRILRLAPGDLRVQAGIALPMRGFGLALDDDGERLYVTHGLDAALSVIDTRNNRIIATLQLADRLAGVDASDPTARKYPHSLRTMTLDAKNGRLYIPGLWMEDSALYVVDTRKLKLEAVVSSLGFLASGSAVTPDGKTVYVSNLAGQLFTIDAQTLQVVNTVTIEAEQALHMAIDADGKRLFVADQGFAALHPMRAQHDASFTGPQSPGHRVVVLDAASGQTMAKLATGEQPVALLLDDQRQRLYVTNRGAGTVTVFDSASYRLLHTLSAPLHPNSLALDHSQGVLYATVKNEESNSPTAPVKRESVVRVDWD